MPSGAALRRQAAPAHLTPVVVTTAGATVSASNQAPARTPERDATRQMQRPQSRPHTPPSSMPEGPEASSDYIDKCHHGTD